jgi:hypothetical protein
MYLRAALACKSKHARCRKTDPCVKLSFSRRYLSCGVGNSDAVTRISDIALGVHFAPELVDFDPVLPLLEIGFPRWVHAGSAAETRLALV